jgi:hypothetical protein
MLVFMYREIERKLAWIGWIGTEPLTAYRAGILARPYAFAFPACHYCPETDLFGRHFESLQPTHEHLQEKKFESGMDRHFDTVLAVAPLKALAS